MSRYGDLERADSPDGSALISAPSLRTLRDHIGDRLFVPLCCALMGVDRLTSLLHFLEMNGRTVDDDSPVWYRNVETAFMLAAGTLREIAMAVDKMRNPGGAKGRFNNSPEWCELNEIAGRWNDKEDLKRLRNRLAFHIDMSPVKDALDHLCSSRGSVPIVEGTGDRIIDGRFSLGMSIMDHAVKQGGDERYLNDLMQTVRDDHGRVMHLLYSLLGELSGGRVKQPSAAIKGAAAITD